MAWQRILAVLVLGLVCACCQTTKENLVAISKKARKLPNDVCGQSDIFKENIYGGASATLGAYPWMAALGYQRGMTQNLTFMAAGSLITDQYVLTAAQALPPNIPSPFKLAVVRLGDLNLDDDVADGASPLDMKIEKIIHHPDYDDDKKTNDIGLIKLDTKVQLDNLKKPICLPSPEFHENSFVGRTSINIGWGKGRKGFASSLAETPVEIQDFNRCKTNYNAKFPELIIDERVFCASFPVKDSCVFEVDTGGPVIMYRRYRGKSKMFLMGIVSFGFKCFDYNYPAIYTNVSSFMYWIVDNLEI